MMVMTHLPEGRCCGKDPLRTLLPSKFQDFLTSLPPWGFASYRGSFLMFHFKCIFHSFQQMRYLLGDHSAQIWPRVSCWGDHRVSPRYRGQGKWHKGCWPWGWMGGSQKWNLEPGRESVARKPACRTSRNGSLLFLQRPV